MHGRETMLGETFGEDNSRTAHWARSVGSSSVKTAQIDAIQEGQQQLAELVASLALKLENTLANPPVVIAPPPSLTNAAPHVANPCTPLQQPVVFPPPPGFPAQPQYS